MPAPESYRKENPRHALCLLVILPLFFSGFIVRPLLSPIESMFQVCVLLACIHLTPATCVFLSSFIALGSLSLRQGLIIFFGTLFTPLLTTLFVNIIPCIPSKLLSLPSYGMLSYVLDFSSASLTLWLFICCFFILAFRRRLPPFFVPAIALSAIISPVCACLLILAYEGTSSFRGLLSEAAGIIFSMLSIPTITLGILLYRYADVIRNDQFEELIYLPDEGPSPTT